MLLGKYLKENLAPTAIEGEMKLQLIYFVKASPFIVISIDI